MKSKRSVLYWVFMLASCALLSIGRVYDERLVIMNINLPVLISIVFAVLFIMILLSIKKVVFSKSKVLFYIFYLSILITTPILWLVFDVTKFGFDKFFNFLLIIVPISIVIIEKYDRKDVVNIIYILLGISFFLALLSLLGLSLSERIDGRTAILGGGPIVFSRWMGFGIISLFFLPSRINIIYKYILIVILFVLALSSGSRGPILALFLTGLVYILFNFNKVFFRISLVLCFIIPILLFTGLGKDLSNVGKFDRVFMNISKKGGSSQSLITRTDFAIGSFILLQNYPLGVGPGNWQIVSNKLRPTHLMSLEYPHNLLLEVACEYGIQTLILILLLLTHVFYLSYNKMLKYRAENSSLYPLLFYLFIFFILNSLVSGMLNDSRLLFVIISCILIHQPLITKRTN
ncbi:MAG: O-antigen ligase family protein [Bacteroidota bacterium]|nr:O-antigen ligase family protein [Bacteroidota bacterium]